MPGTIESTLPSEKRIGRVDPTTITMTAESTSQPSKLSQSTEPPISTCMNLHDIEHAASQILTSRAYTYFHSAAESLQSLKSNLNDWKKISFRPRTLRSVKRVSVECHIMGAWSPLPIFIAPAAMARLAHDEGELCLAKAAARRKIPYCVSTYASMQQHQIAATKLEDGQQPTLFFQLYVPKSKSETIERVKMARRLGFKALVITIDTPVVGKREEDERYKVETDYKSGIADTPPLQERSGDYSDTPVLRGVHSSTLAWHDLKWIQEAWGNQGPVILKGIQSAEDAALAAAAGVDGIYLSNHGGRQLDFAPSSIHTLMEIRKFCPHVLKELQVYIDGGVRRGSDIIKALCLGAHAVSLGRPFMYGLGAYGEAGVLKVIDSRYLPDTSHVKCTLIHFCFLQYLMTKSRRP